MFNYFGSKSRIAHLYPAPKHGLIVEPFAGSARYSLYHSDKEIWINDLNPRIYRIWKWLQRATRKDIEQLPELRRGQDLRRIKWLSEVERDLIGFSACRAKAEPGNKLCGWAAFTNDSKRLKFNILEHLEAIRDWRNVQATWFCDPPYQFARGRYPENEIDYDELAAWCRSRKGQVIVCEEWGATWLPFRPLTEVWVTTRKLIESVWVQDQEGR